MFFVQATAESSNSAVKTLIGWREALC
jgi:hypothetical protein